MRKTLVLIVIPIAFSILGAYLFEFTQRIPAGNWKIIWSNQYDLYNLDSRPIQVLDANWNSVYIKTDGGDIFYCDSEKITCEKDDGINPRDTYSLEVSRNFLRKEAPSFDGNEVDIVRLKVGLPETIRYQYYLTASDGSIWFWYWGDNLFVDINGWLRYGCFGSVIGGILALLVERKLK